MNLGLAPERTKGTVELEPIVEIRQGVELLKNECAQKALVRLRRAFEYENHNPYYVWLHGLPLASVEVSWDQASELCGIAVQLEATEIQSYLSLGEVYASAGLREKASDKPDGALELFGEDARLMQVRSKVQNRRTTPLPFFWREHFLSREFGKCRHRIVKGLRK